MVDIMDMELLMMSMMNKVEYETLLLSTRCS